MGPRIMRVGRRLYASGALDAQTVPAFHRHVAYAADGVDVLDLSDLCFADAAAVEALSTTRRRYPRMAIVNIDLGAQPVPRATEVATTAVDATASGLVSAS